MMRLPQFSLRALALTCALSFSAPALWAQTVLPPAVRAALQRAGVPESSMAAVVFPISTPAPSSTSAPTAEEATPRMEAASALPLNAGSTWAEHRASLPALHPRLAHLAERSMNPASVMKLVTTYAALQSLGADFHWQTQVLADGPVRQGQVQGNLIIQGGGDPWLNTERATEMLQQVRALGITGIQGDLLADNSIFQIPPHNAAEFDDQPDRPYNAAPDGLLLSFKALELHFTPQADARVASVSMQPPLLGVSLPATIALDHRPCIAPNSAVGLDLNDPLHLRFTQTYPASCGERSLYFAYYSAPEEFAPRALAGLWLATGGTLAGQARHGQADRKPRLLLSYPSVPLSQIIATINKYSNNVMAQQVFLSLPVFNAQPRLLHSKVGNFTASQKWLRYWWRQNLPQAQPPTLENGCGLSRKERISAASLAALLNNAAQSPQFSAFFNSLAIAGEEGTVAKMRVRDANNAALGLAHLKTGTLDDVKAIAGYVPGRNGQLYGVVGIINSPRAPAAQAALDALVDWAARD